MTHDEAVARSYDDAPYESHPFAFSHPSRVAAVARLMGLETPLVSTCGVLELGCAGGGNLIPMAMAFPAARFVGIDLSARQIADARETAQTLGVANVDLRVMNIRDVGDDFGRFDYVIAHGVFSWVPPDVQEKLLSVCARNLSPHGVAMISFNTYPGWLARDVLREMMQLHARGAATEAGRAAAGREILKRLGEWLAPQTTPFAQIIRDEVAASADWTDYYLLHEYLERDNRPFYFRKFVDRAAAHGLKYLGDAEPGTSAVEQFPVEMQESLRATARDALELEQTIDVLRKRTMRKTIVCHADVPLAAEMAPERMKGMFVAASLKRAADRDDEFELASAHRLTSQNPATAAVLGRLADAWPQALPADSFSPDAAVILLQLIRRDAAEVYAHPPVFARTPGERPIASPLARLQASRGPKVTSLRHETVSLDEPRRQLLELLDGAQDRAGLVEEIAAAVEADPGAAAAAAVAAAGRSNDGRALRAALRADLDRTLDYLAANALLVQ
jgi:SAM-dependent methyltransferase